MVLVLVVGALEGKGQTSIAPVELLFNGIKKDTIYATKEWLSRLDSIIVFNPDYKIESFRFSGGCGVNDYDYISGSNKFTKGMKWEFQHEEIGCKFHLEQIKITDKQGRKIPPQYNHYIIISKKETTKKKNEK